MASRYAQAAQVRQFVRDRLGSAPVTVFLDPDGVLARHLGFDTYPQFLVVDARGRRAGALVHSLDDALRLVRPASGA